LNETNQINLGARAKQALVGFAIGDALGAPYEFTSPVHDELTEQWRGRETLSFTDDTFLMMSTLEGMASRERAGGAWEAFHSAARDSLIRWFDSGDLRGIGQTTRDALVQIKWHIEQGRNPVLFRINPIRAYDFTNSAGNGAISRALPLLFSGDYNQRELRKFIELTHLHPDCFDSVLSLAELISNGKRSTQLIKPGAMGFWCVETLIIAQRAVDRAKTAEEAFILSQRPQGDNDSTAALTLAIWVWEKGWDKTLDKLVTRLKEDDRARLESVGLL